MVKILLFILFIASIGFTIEPITILKEEDFVDVVFPVDSYQVLEDDRIKITISGTFGDTTITFELITPKHFPAGIQNGELNREAFVDNGVILRLNPANARKLVTLFSRAYGVSINLGEPLVTRISYTIFPLEQEEKAVVTSPVKLKAFYEEEPNYYELYINFDLPGKTVTFMEKDTEYRENFLRSFEAK